MTAPGVRSLTALRRLRHVETDEARRDLGEALAQETALAEREAAIGREIAQARKVSGEYDRNTFAAWLGRMSAERAHLAEAIRSAEARTAAGRTELASRRVAETSAEDALAEVVSAEAAEASRRDQLTLEDVSRALARAAGARRGPN
jgi:hypothetical protein